MTYAQFLESLAAPAPPAGIELALRALWFDARGETDSAWRTAASEPGHHGLRVRAYLRRKAGDEDGARLWYWRAGTMPWRGSARSEWEDIVHTVLADRVVASAYT